MKNQPKAINCFSLGIRKTSWDKKAKLQFFPLNTAQRCGVWHVGVEHRVISPWWPLATLMIRCLCWSWVSKHEALFNCPSEHMSTKDTKRSIYTVLQLVNLGQKYNKYIVVKQCERIGSCSSCIFVIPCPHVSLVSPPLVQGALDSQHASLSESQMRKCQPGSKT